MKYNTIKKMEYNIIKINEIIILMIKHSFCNKAMSPFCGVSSLWGHFVTPQKAKPQNNPPEGNPKEGFYV